MQRCLKVGNYPAGPGSQAMADLMGSRGIWTGISGGLVVMSDAAAVCEDYEEFKD